MIDDIINRIDELDSLDHIQDYIEYKFADHFHFIEIYNNFLYLSDHNFSYVIQKDNPTKLIYHEHNIPCECRNKCFNCNQTGLNNFYTDGEFILRRC